MSTGMCILTFTISYLVFLILLTFIDNGSSVLYNIKKRIIFAKKSIWIFGIIIPILAVFLFGVIGKYVIELPNYSIYIFAGFVVALVQKLIYQKRKK